MAFFVSFIDECRNFGSLLGKPGRHRPPRQLMLFIFAPTTVQQFRRKLGIPMAQHGVPLGNLNNFIVERIFL